MPNPVFCYSALLSFFCRWCHLNQNRPPAGRELISGCNTLPVKTGIGLLLRSKRRDGRNQQYQARLDPRTVLILQCRKVGDSTFASQPVRCLIHASQSGPANPRQPIRVSQSGSANQGQDDRLHLPPLQALAPPAPVPESRPTPAPLLPPGSFTHPDHHNLISVISVRISHPATLPKLRSQPAFSKVPTDDAAQAGIGEHSIFNGEQNIKGQDIQDINVAGN